MGHHKVCAGPSRRFSRSGVSKVTWDRVARPQFRVSGREGREPLSGLLRHSSAHLPKGQSALPLQEQPYSASWPLALVRALGPSEGGGLERRARTGPSTRAYPLPGVTLASSHPTPVTVARGSPRACTPGSRKFSPLFPLKQRRRRGSCGRASPDAGGSYRRRRRSRSRAQRSRFPGPAPKPGPSPRCRQHPGAPVWPGSYLWPRRSGPGPSRREPGVAGGRRRADG